MITGSSGSTGRVPQALTWSTDDQDELPGALRLPQRRGVAAEAAQGLVTRLGKQAVQAVIARIHPDHRASASVATATRLPL